MPPESLSLDRALIAASGGAAPVCEASTDPRDARFAERLRHPLVLTLLLALAGVLALQLWRPLYHLTDDNLTGGLPVLAEASRRLWSGENPLYTPSLFGGYSYLRDAGVVTMLNPLVVLASPLALTPWYFLMMDAVGSLTLICVALAFCWAGLQLRRTLRLQVSDGALVFLSLSYAFSAFNLLVNSSWIGFINPQAAMPIIFAALFDPKRRRAIGLITGAALFALVGHLHPFLYMAGFVGLLALFVARQQRSWEPLLRLFAGFALAVVIVAPLLGPATMGFSTSKRQEALTVTNATASRIEPVQLAASLVLGPAASSVLPTMSVHYSDPAFSTAVAFSLVNVPLLWILARKRKFSLIEIGIGACVVIAALLITRPLWLQFVMLKLPLLRSLRWPFREIADLSFLLHLLALLNIGTLVHRSVRLSVCAGAAAFAVVFLGAPPTFHPMDVDRGLILSGQTAEFWGKLRERIGDTPRVIVGAHPSMTFGPQIRETPFSLLGAYNYAALYGFVNVSGYSPTEAGSSDASTYRPYHFGGIYWNGHAQEIWAKTPGLTLMELVRNQPSVIRVRHAEKIWIFTYDRHSGRVTELARPDAPPADAPAAAL